MSGKICGMSKRHFRRLVAKEKLQYTQPEEIKDEINSDVDVTDEHFADSEISDSEAIKIEESEYIEPDTIPEIITNKPDRNTLRQELRKWCIRHKISKQACDELLQILKSHGLDVPDTREELLQPNGPPISAQTTNVESENKFVVEELAKQGSLLLTIKKQLEIQNSMLIKQTILTERLLKTVFPKDFDLSIFPIKNKEELNEVDEKIKNTEPEHLLSYIRQLIGTTPINKAFHLIFSDELILEVNWDGLQKKIPIKKFKLFNTFVYKAVKSDSFGYVDYEKSMRTGFRLAKNRLYKINWVSRHQPEEILP